jgi:hypothetical protein
MMVMCAARTYPQVLQQITSLTRFMFDAKIVEAAVTANPACLGMFGYNFRNSKKLVLAALNKHCCAWLHVSKSLKNDPDVVRALLATPYKNDLCDMFRDAKNVSACCFYELMLTIDWMQAVKSNGCLIEFAPEAVKCNKQFILAAVSNNAAALKHVLPCLRDADVVSAAACQDVNAPGIFGCLASDE